MAALVLPVGADRPVHVGDRAARRRAARAAQTPVDATMDRMRAAIVRVHGPRGAVMFAELQAAVPAAQELMPPSFRHLVGIAFDDARPDLPPALCCRYPGRPAKPGRP